MKKDSRNFSSILDWMPLRFENGFDLSGNARAFYDDHHAG